jgi:outer membrane protein TolC
VDDPQADEVPLTFFEGWQSAFEWNPDYLIQKKKLIQEQIRLVYARNQRLPQLDLKASYGLNGLGPSTGESWDDLERASYPSWSVGAEMRVPLGGGTKSRNELAIAKLRKQQALVSMKDLEVQIANALDTSLQKARSAQDDVHNYQTVVAFNENLLQTRLEQLKAGKVESRKVLEVEAELLEARISLAEAKVRFKRALMELDLVQGSLLSSLHVELTQRDLEQRTAQMARRGDVTEQQYAHFLREVQLGYQAKQPASVRRPEDLSQPPPPAAVPAQGQAPPIDPEGYERALKLLRQETHNPGPFETP